MKTYSSSHSLKPVILIGALLLAGASLLRAAEPAKAPAAPTPRLFGGMVISTEHVKATVEKINYETREVTINAEGVVKTVTAGPDVKRLAEIHQGDTIEIGYVETVSVLAGDGAGAAASEASVEVVRAPATDKPGAAIAMSSRVFATITALDHKARTVTLQGPKRTVTIKVDPAMEKYDQAKVGDRVYLEVVRAVAGSVTKSAPAK